MEEIFNPINIVCGVIVAGLTAVFGQYWFLFAGFLAFNIADWLTGWYLARVKKRESSKVGAKGILKKVLYWLVVLTAFFISYSFMLMGDIIGVDLGFCVGLGWFVLASYLVNEIRSVLENVVELGVDVPDFLIKGLEIANNAIDRALDEKSNDDK